MTPVVAGILAFACLTEVTALVLLWISIVFFVRDERALRSLGGTHENQDVV